jgi:hypothetical protein
MIRPWVPVRMTGPGCAELQGFPREPNNAGYVSGLFLLGGFELGLGVAASRFLYSKVCRRAR